MNKIKIGNYLKDLRIKLEKKSGKKYTQYEIAKKIKFTENTISELENGKILLSVEKLQKLSKIYGRTIDEILEGEDKKQIKYDEIYYISNPKWASSYDYKTNNLYQLRNEQIKLITCRFKELIKIRLERFLTHNEEDEFRFLFEHFYKITDYAKNKAGKDFKDDYLIFKRAIIQLICEISTKHKDEKYWEIRKLYSESDVIKFSFWSDVCDLKNNLILQDRFKEIDDWQKDMLLAMYQNMTPFNNELNKYGGKYLESYEKENGEYNFELEQKKLICELINHGACINKKFLNVKRKVFEKKRIIDKLEELYELCLKPMEVSISSENGKVETYYIENNKRNRFLNNYYFDLLLLLKGNNNYDNYYEDLEEIYNWFINNEEITEEVFLKIAENRKINTNREKKYWMADLLTNSYLFEKFKKNKENERKIEKGIKEIEIFENKLHSGEKEYIVEKEEIIGGSDEKTIRSYIEYCKSQMSYSDYLQSRDTGLTQTLLDEIDELSLEQIREKYFKVECL